MYKLFDLRTDVGIKRIIFFALHLFVIHCYRWPSDDTTSPDECMRISHIAL